jgi:RNA polymerase sigma factor (sigma-70 family)
MATGQALVRDTAADRDRAFARHLETSLDRSYALAAAILGDRDAAEEATHNAVCSAWRGLDDLRDIERLEAWFTRILVNACRDQLRRRRVRPLSVELPAGLAAPDRSGDLASRDGLERAMAALSPEHRMVVVLRYWRDLTVDEIAERTGERPGTVKSRLHYALEHLRAAYEPDSAERGNRR